MPRLNFRAFGVTRKILLNKQITDVKLAFRFLMFFKYKIEDSNQPNYSMKNDRRNKEKRTSSFNM